MKNMKEKKRKSELLEWTKSIVIAALLTYGIQAWLFAPIIVDGESMNPTIQNQDRMIVSKIDTPERFDIIVFHAEEDKDFIKRVIGLPGDRVEYKNDTLFINGKAYEETYLDEMKKEIKQLYGEGALLTQDFTLDSLLGYETVPENTLFVLGDNRQNSRDSRHIGFVPMEEVVGNAKLVFWPFENTGLVK